MLKPVVITTGEPAGIGPDISLMVASDGAPVVLAGCLKLLKQRAAQLSLPVQFQPYTPGEDLFKPGWVSVMNVPTDVPVMAGQLDTRNAPYVLSHINTAVNATVEGIFSAVVTAPVHKAIINQAGIPFSGHTEYLAEHFNVSQVVMMLACRKLKVALVTTHLPLKDVPAAITQERIQSVIRVLQQSFARQLKIKAPQIYVSGLNPHAGEDGVLGSEEQEVIIPALKALQSANIHGPFPADTLFTPPFLRKADVFLAMYHDQGLAVLKSLGFGESVNITLGLPILRTSVDHGTALELAGTGQANASSLRYAIRVALDVSD